MMIDSKSKRSAEALEHAAELMRYQTHRVKPDLKPISTMSSSARVMADGLTPAIERHDRELAGVLGEDIVFTDDFAIEDNQGANWIVEVDEANGIKLLDETTWTRVDDTLCKSGYVVGFARYNDVVRFGLRHVTVSLRQDNVQYIRKGDFVPLINGPVIARLEAIRLFPQLWDRVNDLTGGERVPAGDWMDMMLGMFNTHPV